VGPARSRPRPPPTPLTEEWEATACHAHQFAPLPRSDQGGPRAHAPCTHVFLLQRSVLRPPSGGIVSRREGILLPLARAAPGPAPKRAPARGLPRMTFVEHPSSAIRTARLQSVAGCPPAAYRPGHLPGALPVSSGVTRLGEGFPLRCFQRFARPHVATQRCRGCDNWHTSGASTPVLSY
jgi:hypothetical protein